MHSLKKTTSTHTPSPRLTDLNVDRQVSPAKEDFRLVEIDEVDNVCIIFPSMGSKDQMLPIQDRPLPNAAGQPAVKTNPTCFTHYRYGPKTCLEKRRIHQGKDVIGNDHDHPKMQRMEKAIHFDGCRDLQASYESNTGGWVCYLPKPAHTSNKMLMHQSVSNLNEFRSSLASREKAEPLDLRTHRKVFTGEVAKSDENANSWLGLNCDLGGGKSNLDASLTNDENQNELDLSVIVKANNISEFSGHGVQELTEYDSETEIASPASIIDDDSLKSTSDTCPSDYSGDLDSTSISHGLSDAAQYQGFRKSTLCNQNNTEDVTMRKKWTSGEMSLLIKTDKVGSTDANVNSESGVNLSVKKCAFSKHDSAEIADIGAPAEKSFLYDVDDKKKTALNKELNVLNEQRQIVNLAQKETCSTKRVTDWAVGIFRRWMLKTKARSAMPDLLKMTVPQINTYLCKFLVDARKTNGSRYPSKSLQAMGQGLLRYVRNNRVYSQAECGTVDGLFRPVNQVLSMELRRTLFYENLQGRMPRIRQRKCNVTKKGKERRVSESPKNLKKPVVQVDEDGDIEDNTTHSVSGDSLSHGTVQSSYQPDVVAPRDENPPSVSFDVQEENNTKAHGEISLSHEEGGIAKPILSLSTSNSLPMSFKPLPSGKESGQRASVKGKSTLRNTRWAYSHFNRWRLAQGELGKALIPDIVDMSPDEVNCYLADYITNVMKTDGTSYIPSCLYSLACGLLRHVRSQGRNDLDFMNSKDSRFADFQNALATRVKSLGQHEPKSRPRLPSLRLLTPAQEEKLWQYHVFGLETAKSLQYSVFYYNFKLFGIKSYMAHRNLRRLQFSVTRHNGESCVLFDNRDMGDKMLPEAGGYRQVYREEPGSSPGSLVELYEVYLTAVGPTGPFYKRLLGLQGPTSRFSKQSVGIRALYVMWTDIWEAVVLE
ncbi:uncharacterized protein LOC135477932 [Liolophura sinensis]|uniref:uncharacterized protein LOC135477932 n=1 Tax=Liolophura sinensis TaxID=3198878 RepID=UPI003158D7AA